MSEHLLQANLACLARAGRRDLAVWMAAAEPDGELDLDAEAVVGVSLRTARGLVRMHGRRDPVAEADRLLPSGEGAAGLMILIGAGAGFALDALERRAGAGRVLLLEPSATSLRATLSRRSWESSIESGRLRVLAGPGYDGWMELAAWVGAIADAPPIVVHPVVGRERPDEVRRAADIIRRLLFNATANDAARRAFGRPYLLNTLANLRHVAASRDVGELFDRFAGVPAFVLAAGPSLNRNLDELRPQRDSALVIAVDTALRPCLAAGVEPDLVVAVDPGEANLRHLAVGALTQRAHLVAEPGVAPGSFDAFGDRVFTFRVDRHHPWPWLQEQGIDRAKLLAWGSVLTTALDLAVKLGCDPVVLYGADFAYTDGQPYCRGTAYEEDWAKAVASGIPLRDVWRSWMRQPVVVERGLDGRDVETSAHLQAFRDWVVEFCGSHGARRFLNGTGAGVLALRPGGDVRPLAGAASPRATAILESVERREPASASWARLQAAIDARVASGAPAAPSGEPGPWDEVCDSASVWRTVLALASDTARRQAAWALREALNREPADPVLRDTWHHVQGARPVGQLPDAQPASRRRWSPPPSAGLDGGADARERSIASTRDVVFGPDAGKSFRSDWYLHFNARRLEHLATLGLDLEGRTVLDVGAGIGDLTTFFADRGCAVLATDAREENLARLRERFAQHPFVDVARLVLDPSPTEPIGTFDIVFCYGVLYHLSDPADALAYLAGCCEGMLLLETAVGPEGDLGVDVQEKDRGAPTVSIAGAWASMSRQWVHSQLSRLFPFVYTPTSQPNHHQFPVDWRRPVAPPARAIFVASTTPLPSRSLSTGLPLLQRRH